jgi:hypothetical protein
LRRTVLLFAALALLVMLGTVPAAAQDGCPAASSGFQAGHVNADWEPGEPIPTDDLLWNVTVLAGLAAEGITLDDAIELFGFGSVENLYAFALAGWMSIDKNADDIVCFKPFPSQSKGKPAYFSNFIDNNARAN